MALPAKSLNLLEEVMKEELHSYQLPSGAEIEIENLPSSSRGVRDVSASASSQGPTAFDNVIEPLGELCDLLLNKIKSAGSMPKTITLEMALALKGKTCLVLVSGESEATLKIKLEWSSK